ncbi:kinase-like protein [Flammula alnicola]|nr:kinase-like protein [Flammula alnicola]
MTSTTNPDLDFFYARPGLKLKNRYDVLRKLGSGVYSSTWLISDSKPEYGGRYLAAKILSLDATEQHRTGVMHELEFLKTVQKQDDINKLPILLDDIEIKGPQGSHLCFVMDLLSSDVSSFRRSAPKKALKPYIVKNIISQVLEALVQLHNLDIIHTDIKGDNILFNALGGKDEEIERILAADPPKILGEFDLDGEKYPILASQPIPHKWTWDTPPHLAELMSFTLIDLGQAQWAGKQPTVDTFTAPALRAPEIIIRSDFGPKIDIWSVGCLTFELLVGRWLFNPEDGGEDWRLEDDHLAKILELTGEQFSKSVLDRAHLRKEYFSEEGKLLRIADLYPSSIEMALANYKILPEDEIAPAASFIKACLRLDSSGRPSAKELELHPWLKGAFCGRGISGHT